MRQVLSTYRYVNQPLTPSLLAEIARAGIPEIEIFCASSHFRYGAADAVHELAAALADHRLHLHSLHAPTERDMAPGRESGTPISISETERVRRLDGVDEIKRAIEIAERLPFRYLIQHMGHGRQAADPRALDAAFSSLEHLSIFAKQAGVIIALENTPGELGSPEALQQFVRETHLDVKFCLDLGHAHMENGVAAAFECMKERLASTHVHDNHGEKDEHLLPGEGSLDWPNAMELLGGAPEPLPFVLELKEHPRGGPSLDQARAAFDKLAEISAGSGVGRGGRGAK